MSVTFLLEQFGPGIIVSGLVAFFASLIARWVAADSIKQVLAATAAGGGYAAGHAKSAGWPAFPPADATHWLLFSALAAIVLGFGYGIGRNSRAAHFGRFAAFGSLLAGTLALLLMPKFKYGWTIGQGLLWLVALVFAASLTGWSIDAAVQRKESKLSLLWLLVVIGGTAISLALSGSILLGQLAAVLAAVVFGLLAAATTGAAIVRAIIPGLATLFVGLIACGYFYAELPWSSALLLIVAPLSSLFFRGNTSLRNELWRAAIALAPVVLAVLLAFRASPPVEYY